MPHTHIHTHTYTHTHTPPFTLRMSVPPCKHAAVVSLAEVSCIPIGRLPGEGGDHSTNHSGKLFTNRYMCMSHITHVHRSAHIHTNVHVNFRLGVNHNYCDRQLKVRVHTCTCTCTCTCRLSMYLVRHIITILSQEPWLDRVTYCGIQALGAWNS